LQNPLEVARAHALRAHHALGLMTACKTTGEFSEAVTAFLSAARAVTRTVVRAERDNQTSAFPTTFRDQLLAILKHPLEGSATPPVYMSRLARGSAPPYGEAPAVPRVITREIPRADDFYFETCDKKPAIELCADYLMHITALVDAK
jgi:hypothetical protein